MTASESELFSWRVTLCDVLHGRLMRARAREQFELALDVERRGFPQACVLQELEVAAHWEWIAAITERGQVFWGQRKNREGVTAEEVDGRARDDVADSS